MDEGLLLFLIAYHGDDCVVAGKLLQVNKSIQRYRANIIKKYTVVKDAGRYIVYLLNGKKHREDGPAYIDVLKEKNNTWFTNDLPKGCREPGPMVKINNRI